ncbi:MAG: heparan-alpha-glucosaminide N-acetyltransferase domain-containing protein, partial [Clostridia bacterium]
MQRIKILDSIRGLCIILMIYHHITFLMMNFGFLIETPFYNVAVGFLQSGVYAVINFCYVSTFFVIAGITSNFSRNNFKRALPVIGVAVAVTVVTFIVMPNEYIKFGVLHCMAVCILAYALIDKLFKKVFDKIHFY